MRDITKHEIADRLAEWIARDEYIEELITENHELFTDNRRLAGEVGDLVAENAALRLRVAALVEENRRLRQYRPASPWGALVNLWWNVKQGGK